MEKITEVTIEIRETGISIQADSIGNDTAEAKKILENALAALEQNPTETHTHEIVVPKP